ncbi:TPA: UvrD-helicase domain-containing protein [Vibrio parahaemolyticus]|nr:UvrD-helicase domain-containing protein [Vibrio parahaemolyticus]HCE3013949.1 UvrD-helicase domain-containing protein [Vibrio parahaemolyticus]
MNHLLASPINREDIAVLAEAEQLTLDDSIRLSILEATHSIDVQACPGSGKTTLIAAKLILLAKKWKSQHSGICVLSHTNVAKDEIIERIQRSKAKEAQALLNYPHFIGTIQEFVHRFLALPFIRSNNNCNITVDNEEYAKKALKLLDMGQFTWLRGTLQSFKDNEARAAFFKESYRYLSQDGKKINIKSRPRAWKSEDNFEKAMLKLSELKKYLDDSGYFLYRDMYTIGQEVLENNTAIKISLRKRFPYVLLDEMQDTQEFQDNLLCEIFPTNSCESIVQRFGDPDQSIFLGVGNEKPNLSFNGKSRDNMSFLIHRSHRFDERLSNLIKPLSFNGINLETEVSEREAKIRSQAHSTNGNFEHTIILFTEDTRDIVIDKFAQIVSSQFSTNHKKSQKFTAKVVGAVGKKIVLNADQLRIGHYWPQYEKSKSKDNYQETSLIDAVRYCQRNVSYDWADKYKFLVSCILKLIKFSGKVDEDGRYYTASTLRLLLSKNGNWESFRKGVLYLLKNHEATHSKKWDKVCSRFSDLLELPQLQSDAIAYIAFSEEPTITQLEPAEESQSRIVITSLEDNKITHKDGFNIELTTIHSVKGETHDATLILETKNHTYDLETMMPYLTGEYPSADQPNIQLPEKPNSKRAFKPNKVFMRQLYVAMSRPKHLLCFAMHADRISHEQRILLSKRGWRIRLAESGMEN